MPDTNLEELPVVTKEQYAALCQWIQGNFISIQSINLDRPLSRLSRTFAGTPDGFPITDDVMREALVDCGFWVRQSRSGDYFVNVSERSPVIRELTRQSREAMPKERHIRLYSNSTWKY